MYSNMCVKIALCLALVACIDGYRRELPLSPDGLLMEITVKNKGDVNNPETLIKIDINEKDKKVVMTMPEHPVKVLDNNKVSERTTDDVPTIEDRHGIRVGTCPLGYTKRGGFCFPDDDY